jgi:hypothetical protein
MKDSPSPSTEAQASAIKYCDRCARRSPALVFDDLTLQEFCRECCDRLNRKRGMAFRPGKPKVCEGPLARRCGSSMESCTTWNRARD